MHCLKVRHHNTYAEPTDKLTIVVVVSGQKLYGKLLYFLNQISTEMWILVQEKLHS